MRLRGTQFNERRIMIPKWNVSSRTCSSSKRPKINLSHKKIELNKDLEVGRDAFSRAADSSWWNWDAGSMLFFWRLPRWSKSSLRDGIKLFVDWDKLPSF